MIYQMKLLQYVGILGVIFFITTTIIGGFLYEGYSHISQYISESYAIGTSHGHLLRWFGYVPSGILILLFGLFANRKFNHTKTGDYGFTGFAIFYGLFTTLVSIFPCDFGCNRKYSDSSLSQLVHTILSILTYVFTPISLLLVGAGSAKSNTLQTFSKVTTLLGITGLCFGMLFMLNSNSPIAGLLQRITELVFLFWVVYCSLLIIKKNPV